MMFEILVTSSVLIVGLLCLRKLAMGKISMRFRYALWLLVAVRLLFPVSFGTSPLSVLNFFSGDFLENRQAFLADDEKRSVRNEEWDELGNDDGGLSFAEKAQENTVPAVWNLTQKAEEQVSEEKVFGEEAESGLPAQERQNMFNGDFSWTLAVGLLWLVGFLAVGGYMLVSQIRFVSGLVNNRQAIPEAAFSGEWRKRLSRRGMKVYQVKGLPSPCLVGRYIYVGEQVPDATWSLSHILAHEFCHRMQGDNFWTFLRCLLVAIYWFDPLVWAAAFAVRQDSELACDEAAVRLLGETQRFAYGRTLLAFLADDCNRKGHLGVSPMLEQGECGIRERITALAGQGRPKKVVLVVVVAAVFLICGCAFTGADQDGAHLAEEVSGQAEGAEQVEKDKKEQTGQGVLSDEQEQQMSNEERNGDIESIQAKYDGSEEPIETAEQAAFEEVLNYHGVMEGRDDSELELNRKLDLQAYYEYEFAEDSKTAENPMVNGWYLLFHNESEAVSLYGLYTEEFGFRGIKMKMMVGGDVNTWDIKWCPSYLNQGEDNIRLLERDSNGLARSIVLKILEDETSDGEIWRLYSGYQYDTGTIDMKMLEPEEYVAWAGRHLSFEADQEAGQIVVAYDGDTLVGALDISAYEEYEVEDVRINTDMISFFLNGKAYGKYFYDDYEGVVLNFAVGLKLKGSDEIWIDGLTPLTVQVLVDENGNFKLQQPTTNAEPCVIRNLNQERSLADLAKR